MECTHHSDEAWKHRTAPEIKGHEHHAGIDLFDDEDDGQFSVYVRYTDGTRFPARTISLNNPDAPAHAQECLDAWADRGIVHDYRTNREVVPTHAETIVCTGN